MKIRKIKNLDEAKAIIESGGKLFKEYDEDVANRIFKFTGENSAQYLKSINSKLQNVLGSKVVSFQFEVNDIMNVLTGLRILITAHSKESIRHEAIETLEKMLEKIDRYLV